jgi:hypothetical protein
MEFADTVARLLLEHDCIGSEAQAADTTFVLQAASKGLLLKACTGEDYISGMERVMRTVLRT